MLYFNGTSLQNIFRTSFQALIYAMLELDNTQSIHSNINRFRKYFIRNYWGEIEHLSSK